MTETEVRLRCIEAAARAPMVHNAGPAAGVLEVAKGWAIWVVASPEAKPAPLGLSNKK